MIVMKFGGSSVANAEKIRQVLDIVKGRLARKPLVIASAFRGVTDDLFKLGEEAVKGAAPSIEPIRKRHQDCLMEMGLDADLLKNELNELDAKRVEEALKTDPALAALEQQLRATVTAVEKMQAPAPSNKAAVQAALEVSKVRIICE